MIQSGWSADDITIVWQHNDVDSESDNTSMGSKRYAQEQNASNQGEYNYSLLLLGTPR